MFMLTLRGLCWITLSGLRATQNALVYITSTSATQDVHVLLRHQPSSTPVSSDRTDSSSIATFSLLHHMDQRSVQDRLPEMNCDAN